MGYSIDNVFCWSDTQLKQSWLQSGQMFIAHNAEIYS
jgi:hypothetical protein